MEDEGEWFSKYNMTAYDSGTILVRVSSSPLLSTLSIFFSLHYQSTHVSSTLQLQDSLITLVPSQWRNLDVFIPQMELINIRNSINYSYIIG